MALVDDQDYELVSQYRWHVYEVDRKSGRPNGPYAMTTLWENGQYRHLRMHCLIMGFKGIDHVNHDGLDNQRHNLRQATRTQNNHNQRPQLSAASQYKGVTQPKPGLWRAHIRIEGRPHRIGDFASEAEAAYAYDAAAREVHGEFACPNFQDEPTQAMREQWQAAREERQARITAERAGLNPVADYWAQREPETYTCQVCGVEFESRAHGEVLYCSRKCCHKAFRVRRAEGRREEEQLQQEEGRLL